MIRFDAFPKPSIRIALVLILAAALAPAFLVIAVTGAEHARYLEEEASAAALRQALAFGDIQIRITESTRQTLATLAALPAFREGNFEVVDRILKSVHAENPEYLNFSLTDAGGRITASSLLARGTDLSGRPHVRRARDTRRFSTGEYILGLVQSEPSFSYSFPLLDSDGILYGTINTLYKLSSYAFLFDSFNLDSEAFLGIVDRKGIRLYFYPPKDTNPVGGHIKESAWEKIRAGSDTGTFLDVSSDGVVRFFGYRKLRLEGDPEPYITVVYATSREKVLEKSRDITRRNLLAMTGAALFALALAWALSELLFGRRLSRIGVVVDRLRGGELGARVGLAGDASDLGRIAAALDDMAQAVERRDAEREEEARRLGRLLDEKSILLKEIHHRVKNNLQMTLSLIHLQEGQGVLDAQSLKGLESRIASMAMVHEMLYGSGNLTDIDLSAYCPELLDLLRETYSVGGMVTATVDCDPVVCNLEKAIPFGLLLSELVTNAFKHALRPGRAGSIRITLKAEGESARLCVSDDGPGLPPDFDAGSSRGLGLQLARALAGQLGGELSWESGGGARFCASFPLETSCGHEAI